MTALEALRTGLRTLWVRPATIVPYYLLAIGATMIARTPLTLGGGLVLFVLRVQGRIEPVVRTLDELEPGVEEGSLTQAQQEALAGLVTPTVVFVLALAILASGALYVVCRGAASAGTIHALFAPLDDRDPLSAGAAGISRDWLSFVAIGVVRAVVYLFGATGIALGIGLSATGIGLLIGIPLILLSLAGLLAGHLLLAFAGQAVVVGDRSALGAIADSVRFPLRAPTAFVLYAALVLLAALVLAIAAPLLEVAGMPRVSGLLVALGIAPAIDAAKTGLYAGEFGPLAEAGEKPPLESQSSRTGSVVDGGRPSDDGQRSAGGIEGTQSAGDIEGTQSTEDDDGRHSAVGGDQTGAGSGDRPGALSRLLAGQRRGLGALATFLRTRPLANVAGLTLFVLGTGLGWLLTGPYGVRLDAPQDVAGVFGSFAAGPFVNIAANNWQVAIGQGFGGIALGVPTVANLVFNGVLVGGLAGVFDRAAFLALVVPHGVVEVPALAVSGGLGLHLGGVGYRWVRGRADAAEVGQRLRQATWVLVGLLPLFVLAAFVEAFLTPRIATMVLG